MSRSSIRAGLTQFLANGTTGVNTWYSSSPKLIRESDYFANQVGAAYGAVGIVHIGTAVEMRKGMGGPTSGSKRLDYPVEIQVLFLYSAAAVAVGGDSGVDAQTAWDGVIDAVKARIRADRTAGGAVWEWGETGGLADVASEPNQLGSGGVQIWGAITTTATEWLTT